MIEGGERHEAFTYPDEEFQYYLAAERFGWTPEEFDNSPAYLVDYMLAISNTVEKARSKKFDK